MNIKEVLITKQRMMKKMKTKPTRENIVANKLVKQSENIDKWREKNISASFWKLFKK